MLKPRNKLSFGFVTSLHACLTPSETLAPLGVYIWLQLHRHFILLHAPPQKPYVSVHYHGNLCPPRRLHLVTI